MKDSYWIETTKKDKEYPKVQEDMQADVVIVGGGLSGLSTAYYLAGKNVVILEADEVCYGASGRNTGKVTAQHGLVYKSIMDKYDKNIAQRYYNSNSKAIDEIENIVKKHKIECGFTRCDAMVYTNDEEKIQEIKDEYEVYQELGIKSGYMDGGTMPIAFKAGIIMQNQAKFNPYAYGLGLAKAVEEAGVSIYENSPVKTMEKGGDGTYVLFVNEKKVRAGKVVFTSQFPFIDHMNFYFTRMYCEQESIVLGSADVSGLMAVNIDTPLHSYSGFNKKLLSAGNNYKSGQKETDGADALKEHVKEVFNIDSIEYEWTSQDYITFDNLPFIGRLNKDDDNVLFATGFCKWGNTNSNVAARVLCSYITGTDEEFKMLYSPERFYDRCSLEFIKQNLNSVYELVKGKMKLGSLEYPSVGEGREMQIDGHTYGAYRDDRDELHILDITCPHVGCVCNFNDTDKTWDCPCHGSRFDYKGDIIKGPATHGLNVYDKGRNPVNPHIVK